MPDGVRVELTETRVVGGTWRRLYPQPNPTSRAVDPAYDRQARLFGDRGQVLLADLKVGVIGAGGVGSLLNQSLARLGTGHLVIADREPLEPSNVPRVVGSTVEDGRIGTPKVEIAERIALGANPNLTFEAIQGDIVDQSVAGAFTDCDYIFLAADSMQARLVFNALVHQYLVPGVQVGSKVPVDETTGDVGDVSRPVTPNSGCLWCNGLIDAAGLQDEALSEEERTAQRYVPEVIAPSVITLNAVAAAEAVNHFLFYVTGLLNSDVTGDFVRFRPRRREVWMDEPRKDADCSQCSDRKASKFARGDTIRLPVRQVRSVTEF